MKKVSEGFAFKFGSHKAEHADVSRSHTMMKSPYMVHIDHSLLGKIF